MISVKLNKNTWWTQLVMLNTDTLNHLTGCPKNDSLRTIRFQILYEKGLA